jgi:hypothetical protein
MQKIVLATLVLAGTSFMAIPAWAAPLGGATPTTPEVGLVQQAQMSGYCRRLRHACEFKSERGEAGEGNCRRYRRECGGGWGYRERERPWWGYRDGRRWW